MKNNIRRFLAAVLALLCALTALSIAASAASVKYDVDYPVVYVSGKFTYIYDKDFDPDIHPGKAAYTDPNIRAHQLYPLTTSLGDIFNDKKVQSQIVLAYNASNLTGNWKIFADKLYEIIEPVYRELRLDGNGNITNGSHVQNLVKPKAHMGDYGIQEFQFTYDSRLDPYENVEKLNNYIDEVIRVTGKSKVNLIGRCLGTTLVSTYLTKYGCGKVETAIFYASAFNGVQEMDDFFTNNIYFDPARIEYYINHQSDVDNDGYYLINSGWTALKSLGFTGLGVQTANDVWRKTAPYLMARLVRATYGTWPGHWAMISSGAYEKAKEYVFGDCKEEYAGMIKKLDKYQKEVMSVWPQTLKRLVEKDGLRIAIFAKYNSPLMPLSKMSGQQADGTVELRTMSLGADSAPIGTTFTSEQLREKRAQGKGQYLSADDMVDASTCLFPDYTWFLKDVPHNVYPKTINRLFMTILHSKTQVTVWNNKITQEDSSETIHVPQFVSGKSTGVKDADGNEEYFIYKIIGKDPATDQLIVDNGKDLEGVIPPDPAEVQQKKVTQKKNMFQAFAEKVIEFIGKIMNLFNIR